MRSKIPSDFRKLVSSAHHQRAPSRGGVLRGDADVAPKKKTVNISNPLQNKILKFEERFCRKAAAC